MCVSVQACTGVKVKKSVSADGLPFKMTAHTVESGGRVWGLVRRVFNRSQRDWGTLCKPSKRQKPVGSHCSGDLILSETEFRLYIYGQPSFDCIFRGNRVSIVYLGATEFRLYI